MKSPSYRREMTPVGGVAAPEWKRGGERSLRESRFRVKTHPMNSTFTSRIDAHMPGTARMARSIGYTRAFAMFPGHGALARPECPKPVGTRTFMGNDSEPVANVRAPLERVRRADVIDVLATPGSLWPACPSRAGPMVNRGVTHRGCGATHAGRSSPFTRRSGVVAKDMRRLRPLAKTIWGSAFSTGSRRKPPNAVGPPPVGPVPAWRSPSFREVSATSA